MAKWNQPCSEKHLLAISEKIPQWQTVAPYLGLTETEEANIVGAIPRPIQTQRLEMLRIWKQKLGEKATYSELAKVFKSCHRQDLVDMISRLISEDDSNSSDEAGM